MNMINMIRLFFIITCILLITSCSDRNDNEKKDEKIMIEKIEIFHIHETPECYICKVSGEYAKEALNTFFLEELESGKIIFKEVDKSDPANKEIVEKYGVDKGFSGIFIGIYSKKGFESKEYTGMYNLNDKEAFIEGFKNHIETLLIGGTK